MSVHYDSQAWSQLLILAGECVRSALAAFLSLLIGTSGCGVSRENPLNRGRVCLGKRGSFPDSVKRFQYPFGFTPVAP